MINNFLKTINLLLASSFITILNTYLPPTYAIEEDREVIQKTIIPNEKISLKESSKFLGEEYLLGPGDILKFKFSGLPLFNRTALVNSEGFVVLPEIDEYYLVGKTIKEIKDDITKKYENIIIDPEITISIESYRPVKFYIYGEVKNPGLYNINYSLIDKTEKSNLQKFLLNSPKLFNALQIANGVTNKADLSKIKIIRLNSDSQGGGKITTKVNFLNMITTGDQSENIRIFDGDTIFIPKTNKILKDQILAINKTNLSTKKINVFITGNVKEPGSSEIEKGSNLIQALASSGGIADMTGSIEFIRFTNHGNTIRRKFKYDGKAKIDSPTNPLLMDGDIIHVRKNNLGKSTSFIKEIVSPVITGYGLYSIFNE